MKIFLKILSNLFFPTFIFLIVGFLAWKNYVPDTWLMGWDSLHPELNFPLAFQRAIFGAWRADQGLGAIAAHAVSADLPHIFLLWIASFFLNQDLLRWFYTFTCLLIGPLGIYFFLKEVFTSQLEKLSQIGKNQFFPSLAAFLGGIYYLLNLATLQNFYLPFEMFSTQFAFLPWLFLFVTKILKEGNKWNYLIFALISILATPMAYAPALFFAYLGALVLFLLIQIVLVHSKNVFKRSFLILLLVAATNAFWILPNLYSIENQSQTITSSKINQLFSPEAFLRNKDYGTVSNTLIHKNFLFTWRAFDFNKNQFVDLFQTWNDYLAKDRILQIGYGIALVSLIGMLFALLKRDKQAVSIFGVGLFALFFLINANYPTGVAYKYLYEHYRLFSEAFRMPFTKFGILFEFVMAFFFGYFFNSLFSFFSTNKFLKLTNLPIGIVAISSLIIFMKPVFDGEFISSVVKTKLPTYYFAAYDFLNKRDGRIAKLPMQTLYNWEQHSWKFEGSAWFSWYLSKNPQLDRDFDRWNASNESFYNEASFALYQKDGESFKKILEKYGVKYLLLDESIINAGGSPASLFNAETKKILAEVGIKQIAGFGPADKKIIIYETDFENKDFIRSVNGYVEFNSKLDYSQVDPIYSQYFDYAQNASGKALPLANLDKRGDVEIKLEGDKLVLENSKEDAKISLPSKDKIAEDFEKKRGFALGYNCDLAKIGKVDKQSLASSEAGKQFFANYYSASEGGVSCDFFDYSQLKYNQGYILRVKGENREGRSLKIYLYNYLAKKMDLEELLPQGIFDEYFVILPKTQAGPGTEGSTGYSLNIETRSFGRIASENILNGIEFYPFDYNLLKSIYKGPIAPKLQHNDLKVENVENLGNAFVVQTSGAGLLSLGQGYDEGWVAWPLDNSNFPIFNQRADHIKVNSWENGWFINSNKNAKTFIVFWPQYLEWGGFFLAALSLLIILFAGLRKAKRS